MKPTITLELEEFNVPACVYTKYDLIDSARPRSYPLSELDAQTLNYMCNVFRRRIFEIAGIKDANGI